MVAAYFNPLAGSYAFVFVLLGLRLWQRKWHRSRAENS
jgi:hypothetical protein